jgi:hypothetical protein
MEQRMSTTELSATNEIRILSDDDLGEVAGGFQTATEGGAGGVYTGKHKTQGIGGIDIWTLGFIVAGAFLGL